MAQMRPREFPGQGQRIDREREVFDLLRRNLPEEAIVAYEPMLWGKNNHPWSPDFVVFWDQVGCLVLEVKNWVMESGTPDQVIIRTVDGSLKTKTNPYKSARRYMHALMGHLEMLAASDADLFDQYGRLRFVVTPAIALMRTVERDLPSLAARFLFVPPAVILSEEALSDSDLLKQRLLDLPFMFKSFGNSAILKKAADLIQPDEPTEDARLQPTPNVQKPPLSLEMSLDEIRLRWLQVPQGAQEPAVRAYNRLRRALIEITRATLKVMKGKATLSIIEEIGAILSSVGLDSFTVGFLGTTGSGKSSLINALAETAILREGHGLTTKTLVRICPPDGTYPHGTTLVRYKSQNQIVHDVTCHIAGMNVDSQDLPVKGEDESVKDYCIRMLSLVEGLEQSGQRDSLLKYLQILVQGWRAKERKLGSVHPLDSSEAETLITEERVAAFVSDVSLYHDNPLTRMGITLVDSPGLGSPFFRHDNEAQRLAKEMDAGVFVTEVDYRLQSPDKAFLRQAIDVQRMKEKKNLIFVLNQIGQINPVQQNPPRPPDQFDQCVEEYLSIFQDSLQRLRITEERPYAVDAACGFWSAAVLNSPRDPMVRHQYRQYAVIDRGSDWPDPLLNLGASRIVEFRAALLKHLVAIRLHVGLSAKLDRLESVLLEYRGYIQALSHAGIRDLSKLQKELECHDATHATMKLSLEHFFESRMPTLLLHSTSAGDVDSITQNLAKKAIRMIAEFMVGADASLCGPDETPAESILKKVDEVLYGIIKESRDEHERTYVRIRKDVINKLVPEILESHVGNVDWKTSESDLFEYQPSTIHGLTGIELQVRQHLLASIGDMLQERIGWLTILDRLHQKWETVLGRQMWLDITGWVLADTEDLKTQAFTALEAVMQRRRESIVDRIVLLESKHRERVEWLKELDVFGNQASTAAKILKELRRAVSELERQL